MKIREIYTVVREYSVSLPRDKELLDERLSSIRNEPSDCLYNGAPKEQLSVQFQIDKGEGWVNFDPELSPVTIRFAKNMRPTIITNFLKNENGPFFLGLPERWLDDPHWRCEKGHVSRYYIKSEELSSNICVECRSKVYLTSPEDTE